MRTLTRDGIRADLQAQVALQGNRTNGAGNSNIFQPLLLPQAEFVEYFEAD